MTQKTNQTFLIILCFSFGLIFTGQARRLPIISPITPEFSLESIRDLLIYDARTLLLNQKINLNTATAQDLDYLPRISLEKANKIVAYRNQIKKFRDLDQLTKIRGIGPKTVKRLEKFLVIHSS